MTLDFIIKDKMMKIILNIFLYLMLTLSTLSCNLKIGEKSTLDEIKGFSVGCLNGIDYKVDLYLKGDLTVSQIDEVHNCAKTTLRVFKNRVQGNKKGEFTPDELRKFIQSVFLQDREISDALLLQLAKLKRVIIGGSEQNLTISDIDRFIIFLDILKKEIVFFQPYIQAFKKPGLHAQLEGENRLRIEKDLKKSISRFSAFIKRFSNSYSLDDMKIFIRELTHFFSKNKEIPLLDEKIKLLGVLKQFVAGGSDSIIQPAEWENLLLGSSHLIAIGVNFLFLKNQTVAISQEGMKYIFSILNDSLDFLTLAINTRPNHVITKTEFLKLSDHLQSSDILSQRLEKPAVRNLFLILFGKVFNVDKKRYGIIELTRDQLTKISRTTQPWLDVQFFLNHQAYSGFLEKNIVDIKKQNSFFSSPEVAPEGQDILKEILELKSLYRDDDVKVFLSGSLYPQEGQERKLPSYRSLTIYNFYHFIARMMKMGYQKDPSKPGIDEKEISNFFTDFHLIAENMGWSGSTKDNTVTRGEAEFMAANILTPSATGFNPDWREKEYLSSHEIIEYLAYAFSFSISLEEINEALSKVCENTATQRAGEVAYDISCFKAHFPSILEEKMDNMPDLQNVLRQMSETEKENLTKALIKIATVVEQEKSQLEATYITNWHLKSAIMALYFVETTINRYDLNGDLKLQNNEIRWAYSTFRGYLSRSVVLLACQKSDRLAKSFYDYTVNYARIPPNIDEDFIDFFWSAVLQLNINYLMEQVNVELWELDLNREKLTLVFSAIVESFLSKRKEIKKTGKQCSPPENSNKIELPLPEVLPNSP